MHPAPVPAPAAAPVPPAASVSPVPDQKPSANPKGWETYEIKSGDNLEKLAKGRLPNGSSKEVIEQLVSDICKTNNIPNRNDIKKDDTILLPPKR